MSGLEFLPLLMLGASTAVTVASSLSQASYEKQVAEFNRSEALRAADEARSTAARDAEIAQGEGERVIGRAAALAGASGFTLGGSAADVLGDLAGQMRYDTRSIIYAGDLRRRELLADAALARARGENAMRQGYFRATSAILSGGYRAASYGRDAGEAGGRG